MRPETYSLFMPLAAGLLRCSRLPLYKWRARHQKRSLHKEKSSNKADLDTCSSLCFLGLFLKVLWYTEAREYLLPGTLVWTEATSSWTISSLLFPSPPEDDLGWTSSMVLIKVLVSLYCNGGKRESSEDSNSQKRTCGTVYLTEIMATVKKRKILCWR